LVSKNRKQKQYDRFFAKYAGRLTEVKESQRQRWDRQERERLAEIKRIVSENDEITEDQIKEELKPLQERHSRETGEEYVETLSGCVRKFWIIVLVLTCIAVSVAWFALL
jgi:hypothetical protein